MQKALIEQHLEQRLEAANAYEVSHVVLTARLEVGEHRDLPADAFEIFEGQFDVGGVGHRDEVKHSIRRTAEGDDDGDGVLKGFLGEDVRGTDILLEQLQNGFAGAFAVGEFVLGVCELGRAVG